MKKVIRMPPSFRRFTVGGEVFFLEEGETLIMPKDIPHAVYGEEKFKMQLIVSF